VSISIGGAPNASKLQETAKEVEMSDETKATNDERDEPATIVYERGRLSVSDLNEEISRISAEARRSGELAGEPLSIEARGEAGFDPVTIGIVVGGYVAKDVWKKIVLPRLIDRWGPDALGPERGDDDGDD
jgi:hypothetical protein